MPINQLKNTPTGEFPLAAMAARDKLESATSLSAFHWAVIIFSLIFSFAAWSYAKSSHRTQNQAKFDQEFDRVAELIQHRVENYENALWSGVAMLGASNNDVSFEQWQTYAKRIDIENKYPGINGIGVIHALEKKQVPAYLKEQRQTRPDFHIHPAHQNDQRYPISYIIPVKGNEQAVGLDMAHERNRFSAAKKSRDTGKAQITGPITLVQDDGQTPGFLFFAPFYCDEDCQNTQKRREHFEGLVYAPFIVKKLMLGVLGSEKRQVGIRLTDDKTVIYNELLDSESDFDATPEFKRKINAPMFGRNWEFEIWSSRSFSQANRSSQPLLILLGGILVDSLLVFLFVSISRSAKKSLDYADLMMHRLQENAQELTNSKTEITVRAERLRETQYQLELAVSGSKIGIWDWDVQTGDVYFSNIWHEQLGEKPNSLNHMTDFEKRIHPGDLVRVKTTIQNYLDSEIEEYRCKFRMQHVNGSTVWILATGRAERNSDDTSMRFAGTHTDITALVEIQQQFEDLNNNYEAMLELLGSIDGLWDWEIISGKTTYAAGFRKILGFAGNDEVGFPNTLDAMTARIHPDDASEFWRTIEGSFETQKPFVFEFRLRKKDGDYIWVRSRATIQFEPDGSPSRLVGSIYDITAQKQNAIELESVNTRLRRSNDDLKQFAYVASHDLQEPLRAISGFVQLLDQQYSEQLDDRGKKYIQHSVSGAARMNQLIFDLLLFSRVSRDDSDFEDVDLKHCAERACEELKLSIAESNAQIEIGDLGVIPGIESLLIQLFQNLLGNSIKYCEAPPVISICSTVESDQLVVRVQDNGIGIPETYRNQVFSLFKRLHHRDEYPGTGIGLAICQRVAERHHGIIEIESNDHEGICFVVRFSIDKATKPN